MKEPVSDNFGGLSGLELVELMWNGSYKNFSIVVQSLQILMFRYR